MPSNLIETTSFQGRCGLGLKELLVETSEWEYLEVTPYLSRDAFGILSDWASLATPDGYGVELTRFFNDPKWDWGLEIQDAWLHWSQDQLGDRGIQVIVYVYDPTVPVTEWDDPAFGKYVRFETYIYYANKSATSERTISQTQLAEFNLTGLPPEQRLFLYVAGRQDAGRPVTAITGQVVFRFTKYAKNG
jgi:hypothetical protein